MSAKKSNTSSARTKVVFGKRKTGRFRKSYNKHTPKPKQYRGQGR